MIFQCINISYWINTVFEHMLCEIVKTKPVFITNLNKPSFALSRSQCYMEYSACLILHVSARQKNLTFVLSLCLKWEKRIEISRKHFKESKYQYIFILKPVILIILTLDVFVVNSSSFLSNLLLQIVFQSVQIFSFILLQLC